MIKMVYISHLALNWRVLRFDEPNHTTCGLATVLSSLALLLASVCMMSSGYRVALWSSAGFSVPICPKLEGHSFDSARMADSVSIFYLSIVFPWIVIVALRGGLVLRRSIAAVR